MGLPFYGRWQDLAEGRPKASMALLAAAAALDLRRTRAATAAAEEPSGLPGPSPPPTPPPQAPTATLQAATPTLPTALASPRVGLAAQGRQSLGKLLGVYKPK